MVILSLVLPEKNLEISRDSHKGKHLFQDVIIIEDDDDDALNLESDAGSSENQRSISSHFIGQRLNPHGHPTSSFDATNYLTRKMTVKYLREVTHLDL